MKRGLLGLVLLALSCIGWWVDARIFFASWLAAWWWTLGLVLGSFINAWMHRLTGGNWGLAIRPWAERLGTRLPSLLLLGLPLLAGLHALYPWAAQDAAQWTSGMARPAFARTWLSMPFFAARLLVYALVWWWTTRPGSVASKGRAAASLLLCVLATSLAAVDLLMSLMPGWPSTGFALLTLCAQALAGAALCVSLSTRVAPAVKTVEGQPPLWRDLGNLLLMWSMSWAYLAFMQFLVIWAENLPREIAWYLPRLHTGWRDVGIVLVVALFALPCLALLMRPIKDQPMRLGAVASLLMAASLLDAAWTVLPSVAPHSLHGWWMVPLMGLGMLMWLLGALEKAPERAPPELSHGRA